LERAPARVPARAARNRNQTPFPVLPGQIKLRNHKIGTSPNPLPSIASDRLGLLDEGLVVAEGASRQSGPGGVGQRAPSEAKDRRSFGRSARVIEDGGNQPRNRIAARQSVPMGIDHPHHREVRLQ
jgi:hypothetical protein